MKQEKKKWSQAMTFIVLFGIVSLFSDMTHEGASSIRGAYLSLMGASAGMIGFVGLVIPHLVRSVVGPDHRKLIPISMLTGAIFLIWVDVGARMIKPPAELPIGILTAFVGAPLFLYLIATGGGRRVH